MDDVELLRCEASDHGNAQCMAAIYSEKLIYSPALGWLQYTGTHWQMVSDSWSRLYAAKVLSLRGKAAQASENNDLIRATMRTRKKIVDCALGYKDIVSIDDVSIFDSDPDLLNVQNGVVNLRTGSIEEHKPCQYLTYCLPVEYKRDADMSLWVDFIHQSASSEEMAHYIQRLVGYTFTGHTREEKMFYLYGPTRAGKGTFTETLLSLLRHPFGVEVDFNSFTTKREGDTQNFDLAPLKASRFVVASESNRYQTINPAKIKQVTGGNYIRCAFKYGQLFEYRPQYKVWLVSNHNINADPDDDALWGRVQVIHFPVSHLDREDTELKERLRSAESLEGVLRWVIEGAILWYAEGRLMPPVEVKQETQRHRDSQDYIGQWISECCVLDADGSVTNEALMNSYNEWCKSMNVKPVVAQRVTQTLVDRFGCKRYKGSKGIRGIEGIFLAGGEGGEGGEWSGKKAIPSPKGVYKETLPPSPPSPPVVEVTEKPQQNGNLKVTLDEVYEVGTPEWHAQKTLSDGLLKEKRGTI